ncbi:MAG: zinc-binding dehydrogenase [Pseudomonadota bacterium]
MPTEATVVVLPQEQGKPLYLQSLKLPDPGPHEVVVQQFAGGICHSQLHQMHNPRETPILLGHESTGKVLATGAEVDHVAEGDMVLVTWVPRNVNESGRVPARQTLTLPGDIHAASQNVFTWADCTIADEQYVVKVQDDITRDVTSIIGCAVMTGAGAVINTAEVKAGESVAVFGVGGVGLSAVVAAKKAGANPIIAVDLDNEKLEFAKKFGATHAVNGSEVDAVAKVHEITQQADKYTIMRTPVSGVDYAFDCIGVNQTISQILGAIRNGQFGAEKGGVAVLVGIPQGPLEMMPIDLVINEKSFIGSIGGSCCPDKDFPEFVQWHESGDLDLNQLVTERFRLEQINEAATALENGEISGRAILDFQ